MSLEIQLAYDDKENVRQLFDEYTNGCIALIYRDFDADLVLDKHANVLPW